MPNAAAIFADRDSAQKEARAAGSGILNFSLPGVLGATQTNTAGGANRDYYSPVVVRSTIVVDQILAEVQSASGTNFRIGLYASDQSLQPIGAPLLDSGSLSCASTGIKTYTPASPIIMTRGIYLTVFNSDSAPTMKASKGEAVNITSTTPTNGPYVTDMWVSRAYAAFPTPGTAWTTQVDGTTPMSHRVYFRRTNP